MTLVCSFILITLGCVCVTLDLGLGLCFALYFCLLAVLIWVLLVGFGLGWGFVCFLGFDGWVYIDVDGGLAFDV